MNKEVVISVYDPTTQEREFYFSSKIIEELIQTNPNLQIKYYSSLEQATKDEDPISMIIEGKQEQKELVEEEEERKQEKTNKVDLQHDLMKLWELLPKSTKQYYTKYPSYFLHLKYIEKDTTSTSSFPSRIVWSILCLRSLRTYDQQSFIQDSSPLTFYNILVQIFTSLLVHFKIKKRQLIEHQQHIMIYVPSSLKEYWDPLTNYLVEKQQHIQDSNSSSSIFSQLNLFWKLKLQSCLHLLPYGWKTCYISEEEDKEQKYLFLNYMNSILSYYTKYPEELKNRHSPVPQTIEIYNYFPHKQKTTTFFSKHNTLVEKETIEIISSPNQEININLIKDKEIIPIFTSTSSTSSSSLFFLFNKHFYEKDSISALCGLLEYINEKKILTSGKQIPDYLIMNQPLLNLQESIYPPPAVEKQEPQAQRVKKLYYQLKWLPILQQMNEQKRIIYK